ncbi:uncharacterized protein LOC116570582 isoform X1 [Mustela erminea]|uniref:uncharacterized protein LOC116570582 isoform X1 n=1 Tax=Mustela erminea TaxID=36723 RepID=UPI001387231D|nr:uncharacterized protein LOC116570582 isoform X1 [Mustela erminea]
MVLLKKRVTETGNVGSSRRRPERTDRLLPSTQAAGSSRPHGPRLAPSSWGDAGAPHTLFRLRGYLAGLPDSLINQRGHSEEPVRVGLTRLAGPRLLPAREHAAASHFPWAAADPGAGMCSRGMGGLGGWWRAGEEATTLGMPASRLLPQAPGVALSTFPSPAAGCLPSWSREPGLVGSHCRALCLLLGEHTHVACTCVYSTCECAHIPHQIRSHWKQHLAIVAPEKAGTRLSGWTAPEHGDSVSSSGKQNCGASLLPAARPGHSSSVKS